MKVLAHQGIELRIEHPECCAMPKLENGDLPAVAGAAERISAYFAPMIDEGWDIVPLTTSCSLMLKFEWPLINTDNDDVTKLSNRTYDLSQYVVALVERNRPRSHRAHG